MATMRSATLVLSQLSFKFPRITSALPSPMKTRARVIVAIVFTLLMGGTVPSPLQRADVQHDLAALAQRGITYRFLSDDRIELTYPISGEKRVKSLREPGEATIRAWAAQRGIPILEIDPNTIDTNQFRGWFRHWSTVPLSNTNLEPLVVGDADHNGMADVYGTYWDSGGNQQSRVYQVDTSGRVYADSLNTFSRRLGIAQQLIDSDNDSLVEFTMIYLDSLFDFEQQSRTSVPSIFNFGHQLYQGLYPSYTGMYFGNLDGDGLLDFLYKGSESDSISLRTKVYVSEYDSQAHNFVRVWSTDYGSGGNVSQFGGFAVSDFDHDGKMEFAVAEMTNGFTGRVHMVENVSNNNFTVTWEDSVPIADTYYVGEGDVDGDGFPELFVGGTPGDGNWTVVFEADSNDHYSPRLVMHLLSGGLFDNPQYLTTDVDGDGKLELVICAGADIYMFKSNADNQYYLWYLKRENARDGIQFYDFNNDGRKDFIVSKNVWVDPPGYPRNYADIYVATSLVSVKEHRGIELPQAPVLYPNYPNPFNPSTRIVYRVTSRGSVNLRVYDILGREVGTLVNEVKGPGEYQALWDGRGCPSGVYFYRLQSNTASISKKMLLIR